MVSDKTKPCPGILQLDQKPNVVSGARRKYASQIGQEALGKDESDSQKSARLIAEQAQDAAKVGNDRKDSGIGKRFEGPL